MTNKLSIAIVSFNDWLASKWGAWLKKEVKKLFRTFASTEMSLFLFGLI